jgi:hypothetical protein
MGAHSAAELLAEKLAIAELRLTAKEAECQRLRNALESVRSGFWALDQDYLHGRTREDLGRMLDTINQALVSDTSGEPQAEDGYDPKGGCMADWAPGEEEEWNALSPEEQRDHAKENLRKLLSRHSAQSERTDA